MFVSFETFPVCAARLFWRWVSFVSIRSLLNLQVNSVEDFPERFLILGVWDFHAKRCRADHLQSAADGVVEDVEAVTVDKLSNLLGQLIGCFDENRYERLKSWNFEWVIEEPPIVLPPRIATSKKSIIQLEQFVSDVRLLHADFWIEHFLNQLRTVDDDAHEVNEPNLHQLRILVAQLWYHLQLFYRKNRGKRRRNFAINFHFRAIKFVRKKSFPIRVDWKSNCRLSLALNFKFDRLVLQLWLLSRLMRRFTDYSQLACT